MIPQFSQSDDGAFLRCSNRQRSFTLVDTTPNPGTTSISEVKFNLRYPGQYADEESGLFYNYFRSYDARTGR